MALKKKKKPLRKTYKIFEVLWPELEKSSWTNKRREKEIQSRKNSSPFHLDLTKQGSLIDWVALVDFGRWNGLDSLFILLKCI